MYSRFVKALIPLILLGCCLAASRPVMAEVLDELQVQPDKRDNVVRIKFNARIRYVRHAAADGTNSMLVYFQIVQGKEMQVHIVESLQSKPVASLPGVTVSFPPQPGVQIKELMIRFSKRTVATVGQGPDGQSLDIEFSDVGKSAVKDINRLCRQANVCKRQGCPGKQGDSHQVLRIRCVHLAADSEWNNPI